MAIAFGRLRIEELIVHDVPSPVATNDPDDPASGLILSEVECALTDRHKNFFAERIKGSMAKNATHVLFDPESDSPVAELVQQCLQAPPASIVDPSQMISRHLFSSQSPRNSPGILALARGYVGESRSLAILKIEREEGMRISTTEIDGKSTFDIQVLQDLMLTSRTRVFKAGVFVQEGDTVESISGALSDLQSSYYQNRGVADFFIARFLGCRPSQEPRVSTEAFLRATEDFINTEVVDPEQRAHYLMAAVTTLKNQQPVVRPEDFAREHLEQNYRAPYLRSLVNHGVPTTQFEKDTTLVKQQLELTRFDFSSGIVVIAPQHTIDQQLQVEGMQDGTTSVQIRDQLKTVQGGRSARSRTRSSSIRRRAAEVRAAGDPD